MPITIVNNIFSPDEIDSIYESVSNAESVVDSELGRLKVTIEDLSENIIDKLESIVQRITNTNLQMGGVVYVEYNNLYGIPNLPPHVDADSTDILINIQLESNTSWNIGLNLEVYDINDNCGLLFNPNEEIHWRVHKDFVDREYVKMLFVRFYNASNFSDYSHLPTNPDHDMFKDAREYRDQAV
jgi:hypothetical protein